jgi:GNAT superfamily N-acetyltransferase
MDRLADLSPSFMTYLFDRHSETAECLCPIVGNLASKIQICSGEENLVQRLAKELFPQRTGLEQWSQLAGVGRTGTVEVGHFRGGLWLEFYEPGEKRFHGVLRVFRRNGQPVVQIDSFRIRPRFQRIGLGKAIFLRQMTAASELGFKKIETVAGRRPGENGYYSWPRLGFDGKVPATIRRAIRPPLNQIPTLLDLCSTEAGRRFWLENGQTVRVAFDLTSGSRSRRVFEAYLAKSARVKANYCIGQPFGR